MNIAEPRLGVDIGRVIIDGSGYPAGADTAFFGADPEAMLRTPAVPGSFAALTRLTRAFAGRVWLVSKCGEHTERRTLAWLAHHDFAGVTGIPANNVRFCRARPDKAIHCAELGITHFVDDRPDVHDALAGLVPHRYLFAGEDVRLPPGVLRTTGWSEAEPAILADL
jgi:hypothetical protein